MAKVEVQLFQIPCVKLDGEAVSFPFKRVDALFYYLACQKSATRQELVNLLWEDCSEETGYKNLRHTIYTLRKCLGSDIVLTSPKTEVRLNPEREVVCDFDQMEPQTSQDVDQFLRGFTVKNASNFNSWVDQLREQLNIRTLGQLSSNAADALKRGDLAAAEQFALEYLNRDGLDEKMVTFLMRLYRQEERFYKAVNLYQRLKEKLADELGISPLHETTALYYEIVNQWNQTTDEEPDGEKQQLLPSRAALSQKLRTHYQNFLESFNGSPSLLFYGEAGCGKSYLIQHFLRSCDPAQFLLLTGNCGMTDQAAYLEPWKSIMLSVAEYFLNHHLPIPENTRRTVAPIFPVFSDSSGDDRDPRQFSRDRCSDTVADAVTLLLSMVAQQQKILLVFENLQWMDAASLDLLCHVLRRLGGSQLMLLATSRTLNLNLTFAFDDSVLLKIPVPCLTEEETTSFMQSALGREIPLAVQSRIYEATEGNPKLLRELAESLQGKPLTEETLPDSRSLLRQRLSGLSPEALHLANTLALFQEKAPCRLLIAVTGFSTAQLYDLSVELEQHNLVEEHYEDGESYLQFTHPHMRSNLYQMQSYFKRQPQHLLIADHLERSLREGDSDAYLQLVYHCEQGGDTYRAFRYKVLYLDVYTRSCCELPPQQEERPIRPLPAGSSVEDLLRELDQELRRLRRQPEEHPLDELELLLQCARSRYLIYTGKYQEGITAAKELLDRLSQQPDADPEQLLRVQQQLITYGFQTEQLNTCVPYIARGLELAEQAKLPHQRARYLLYRGVHFCRSGDYYKGSYFLQEALEQMQQLPGRHSMFAAVVHTWLGECKRRQQDFVAACAEYKTAADLLSPPSYLPGSGFLYTCYGRAAYALGDDYKAAGLFATALSAYEQTRELPGRALAQSYSAYYAAKKQQYDEAAAFLAASWESASQLSSLVEQGVRDSVLAQLRQELDLSGETDNALHRYLYRPLDIYCHRGMQRLRDIPGAYEYDTLSECLKFSIRQAKPLSVENLYSKNKNFMTE